MTAPAGRWWGWGDRAGGTPLSASGLAMLRSELGEGVASPAVELDQVAVAQARELPTAIADAVAPPTPPTPT